MNQDQRISVCVFCGSRHGVRGDYREAAVTLGRALAERGVEMVYGGGAIGLMGDIASAVLDAGGEVYGVLPRFLAAREVLLPGLTETVLVDDLFERKSLMLARSHGFITLAGGIGTYDELLEVVSLRQLEQLPRPIGIVNTAGYFDPMLAVLDQAVSEGFVDQHIVDMIAVDPNPETLLEQLLAEAAQLEV